MVGWVENSISEMEDMFLFRRNWQAGQRTVYLGWKICSCSGGAIVGWEENSISEKEDMFLVKRNWQAGWRTVYLGWKICSCSGGTGRLGRELYIWDGRYVLVQEELVGWVENSISEMEDMFLFRRSWQAGQRTVYLRWKIYSCSGGTGRLGGEQYILDGRYVLVQEELVGWVENSISEMEDMFLFRRNWQVGQRTVYLRWKICSCSGGAGRLGREQYI